MLSLIASPLMAPPLGPHIHIQAMVLLAVMVLIGTPRIPATPLAPIPTLILKLTITPLLGPNTPIPVVVSVEPEEELARSEVTESTPSLPPLEVAVLIHDIIVLQLELRADIIVSRLIPSLRRLHPLMAKSVTNLLQPLRITLLLIDEVEFVADERTLARAEVILEPSATESTTEERLMLEEFVLVGANLPFVLTPIAATTLLVEVI